MPKCILSGQVKSTFTQEQADGRYIQMTNGATTTLASSLQVSGINNIEFTEEGEESITASNVSYSNTTSGMTSGNVQNAIDELFQSVSEGKSLIAAAVTDKGVETAATDSFATMAGNIRQISGGQVITGEIEITNSTWHTEMIIPVDLTDKQRWIFYFDPGVNEHYYNYSGSADVVMFIGSGLTAYAAVAMMDDGYGIEFGGIEYVPSYCFKVQDGQTAIEGAFGAANYGPPTGTWRYEIYS